MVTLTKSLPTTDAVRVTAGRVSAVHTVRAGRTLCGRLSDGMLTLTGMDGWARMGWSAASSGPCQRCARKA